LIANVKLVSFKMKFCSVLPCTCTLAVPQAVVRAAVSVRTWNLLQSDMQYVGNTATIANLESIHVPLPIGEFGKP